MRGNNMNRFIHHHAEAELHTSEGVSRNSIRPELQEYRRICQTILVALERVAPFFLLFDRFEKISCAHTFIALAMRIKSSMLAFLTMLGAMPSLDTRTA